MFNTKFFSKLFDELFPLNRSILGDGYKQSLDILNRYINFKYMHFKSGKKIFDWKIPKEWKLIDGYILSPQKKKICDYNKNNLNILNYSYSINKNLNLIQLKKFLHTLKKVPNAVPYTFSYYKKKIGFNIKYKEFKKLKQGTYKAFINSKFKNGKLIVAEKVLKGNSNKEFLLSSYLCHPSMANNELSGPLVLLGLFEKIRKWKKKNYTYKFVINPETIGSLCYLYRNKKDIKKKLAGGIVLTCLGGPQKQLSFKKTKQEDSDINKLIKIFEKQKKIKVREYDPITGSDERQYCSPGFNLPVAQVARTVYRDYKEYHTSLDNKKFMNIDNIKKSIDQLEFFLKAFDNLNGKIIRKNKFGEIFLDKFNLYKDKNKNYLTQSILYILSCGENRNELLDLILSKNLKLEYILDALNILKNKKIIKIIK